MEACEVPVITTDHVAGSFQLALGSAKLFAGIITCHVERERTLQHVRDRFCVYAS